MSPPATRSDAPSCVLLLSLWTPPATPWHARLVGTDARVHDFDSPFELARFVTQAALPQRLADAAPATGLR